MSDPPVTLTAARGTMVMQVARKDPESKVQCHVKNSMRAGVQKQMSRPLAIHGPTETIHRVYSPVSLAIRRSTAVNIHNPQLHEDPLKLHNYVSSFKCPHFLRARLQVNYDINLDLIVPLAEGYWDWQLPLFLCYGFPMNLKGHYEDIISATENLSSALQFPDYVTAYLQDESQHQAILSFPPSSLEVNSTVKREGLLSTYHGQLGPALIILLIPTNIWVLLSK